MYYERRSSSLPETRTSVQYFTIAILLLLLTEDATADGCFFPVELQGAYVTQQTSSIIADAFSTAEAAAAARAAATTAGPDAVHVRYSQVHITADAIPIWGQCHRRIGHNVILQIDSDASECYRCIQLRLLSRNVLRVRTADRDLIAKCYTNEAKALATCPGAIATAAAVGSELAADDEYDGDAADADEYEMDEVEEWQSGDDYGDATEGEQTEIILYKTLDFDGQPIRREFCPIDGRFRATYNVHDADDVSTSIECAGGESQLDNCPSGSALNLRFRRCSFADHEQTFECLGHWIGAGGQRFVALMNTAAQQQPTSDSPDDAAGRQTTTTSTSTAGPQYRCATYTTTTTTSSSGATVPPGVQHQAHLVGGASARAYTIHFSNDSTCAGLARSTAANQQRAMTSTTADVGRSETLQLFAAAAPRWPHQIFCSYPDWMRGRWQHMDVDQSTVVYRDQRSFKTLTMRCVENEIGSERFLVVARTQCGEEQYRCVWATQRAPSVLEFQVGARSAANVTMDLCDDRHFAADRWQTQARLAATLLQPVAAGAAAQSRRRRLRRPAPEPCPVRGEFHGRIPDAEGLCARLVSDCAGAPDRMHYVVSECGAGGVVYEERQYRCLGQWHEAGLVYTYAQRTDVHQHQFECFVGGVRNATGGLDEEPSARLFIKEAGEHCQRHVDPYQYGMELQQTGYCSEAAPAVKADRSGGGSGGMHRTAVQANDGGRPDSAMVPILVHTNSRHNVLAMAAAAAAAEAAAAAAVADDSMLTNAVDLAAANADPADSLEATVESGVLLGVSIRRKPTVAASVPPPAVDDPLDGSRPRTISQWDFDDSMNALDAGTLEATKTPAASAAVRWHATRTGGRFVLLSAAAAVLIGVLRLSG